MRRAALRAIAAVAAFTAGSLAGAGSVASQGVASAGGSAGVAAAATAAPPLKIMALGDSITYGVGSLTSSSYRVDLLNRLNGVGMDVDFVGSQTSGAGGDDLQNEGHKGWTISQISEQIDRWLSTYTPDVVLLMIGTNDTARSLDLATAPGRLSALITRLRTTNPAGHVFVAKIPGVKEAGGQARADAFNARIPAIVAAQGSHVHLVDQSTVDGLDLRDNLHPDDVGFAKMSYNWFRGLEGVYNTTGTAWPEGANPYRATKAQHCTLTQPVVNGVIKNVTVCRWWQLRSVTSTRNGGRVTLKKWQTQRIAAQSRKVWVKGRYVTRTLRVAKWCDA
jgi:lysophospholipase L1-like esterase